ncbi:MAG TPA: AAA family ATPase [Clostridiaceae bacterium]|nr:AAA family ATPase [Clostridiaceae bacterium]
MLVGISIKNYALLQELQLGLDPKKLERTTQVYQLEKLDSLQQFTVLIGPNDSGKTTFFEALEFVSNLLKRDAQVAANKSKQGSYYELMTSYVRNGAVLEFDLVFKHFESGCYLRYLVMIAADHNYRPFVKKEFIQQITFNSCGVNKITLLDIEQGQGYIQLPTSSDSESKTEFEIQTDFSSQRETVQLTERKISALSVYGKMQRYQILVWLYQRITRFYFARLNKLPILTSKNIQTGGHKHLNRNVTNIENVLSYLRTEKPKQYKSLLKRLNDNLPSGNKIDLTGSDSNIGAGNLKLLILYLILADQRPIIALDQPDAGLYYEMINALLIELRDYSIRNPESQIFISTHSANMLDAFAPEEVWSFDRTVDADNQPQITAKHIANNPVIKAMYEEGVGLGSLWYSGYFESV